MKILRTCSAIFGLVFAVVAASAQTSFQATMESPRLLRAGFGILGERLLMSDVAIEFAAGSDVVQIFRSPSPNVLGDIVYTLEESGWFYPGPDGEGTVGWMFGGGRNLTDSELSDLRSGLWWLNVNPTAAGSELRAQILPVPEPESWALLGIGLLVGFARMRRKGRLLARIAAVQKGCG